MFADLVDTGLASWWAPALAFLAGVVSFASPCVLPLVPGYVSFVTGEWVVEDAREAPPRPIVPILLFIGGFTVVFVMLFLFATNLFEGVRLLKGTAGRWVAGGIVIAVGLLMIAYARRIGPFGLYAERRPWLSRVRPGPRWAFPVGMAFAAGWTPCIGPTLTGIIAIAGAEGSVARGTVLLVCYSLGLGLPFLLVGLGVQRLMGAFDWIKRHYTAIATVSGVLLVVVGVLIGTGTLTRWLAPLARIQPGL